MSASDPIKRAAPARRKPGGLAEAILETAAGLHQIGAMDDAIHARIVARHSGRKTGTACATDGREPL